MVQAKLMETIFGRRSVRKFDPEYQIPEEDLELILRAAMAAPSGSNLQPWHFIVTRSRQELDALADRLPYGKMLNTATLAITVCGDTEKTNALGKKNHWVVDGSAAAQNILLTVHGLNLGAVWVAVYPYADRSAGVSGCLGLPEHIKPLCVIPIGKPAVEGNPMDKWNPEAVHFGKW